MLGAAPAVASSTFTVASISVRYGSGIVDQTITLAGSVVGTPGDLAISAVTGGGGLVAGLSVSPSTHGVCTQTANDGYDVAWHCVPNGTWGASTIAVLINTGSPNGNFAPGTRDWPNAETTTIADANIGAEETGTVSLLAPITPAPVPPTAPLTHVPLPPPPKPSSTSASDGSTTSAPAGQTTAADAPSSAAAALISPSPSSSASAPGAPSASSISALQAPSASPVANIAVPGAPAKAVSSVEVASTHTGSSTTTATIAAAAVVLTLSALTAARARRR